MNEQDLKTICDSISIPVKDSPAVIVFPGQPVDLAEAELSERMSRHVGDAVIFMGHAASTNVSDLIGVLAGRLITPDPVIPPNPKRRRGGKDYVSPLGRKHKR